MLDEIRSLQGSVVGVTLVDRSRLDEATVCGVVDERNLWLHSEGRDVLVPLSEVLEVWPIGPQCRSASS